MDPTKPILDLYGDSFYTVRDREEKPTNYKSSTVAPYPQNNYQSSSYNQNYTQQNTSKYSRTQQMPQKRQQPSYTELEDKYQELYQAYKDKSSRISELEDENDAIKSENSKLRSQIDRYIAKNQEAQAAILSKNLELEEAYRRLQEEMRGRGRGGIAENGIDKLEDGLREAINSNYQILRESALAELKQFMTP